jgi:hypothetical protein
MNDLKSNRRNGNCPGVTHRSLEGLRPEDLFKRMELIADPIRASELYQTDGCCESKISRA